MQDVLDSSTETLLEVHNISTLPLTVPQASRSVLPRSLERFAKLRVVTVLDVRHMLYCPLPRLPHSVRKLALEAGQGLAGCDSKP